jgi:betaine-aldehyde dehydrogenase
MNEFIRMYIDGAWVPQGNCMKKDLVNPSSGEVFSYAVVGEKEHAEQAIQSARKAFDQSNWSEEHLERARILHRVADDLEDRIEEFTLAETINTGKILEESRYDVIDAVGCLRYFAQRAGIDRDLSKIGETDQMETFIVREPIGVCALIVPWNYPLATAVWKMAPALAAGNTLVLKPSSNTPVTVAMLFDLFDQSSCPPGVVNLVLGSGKIIGDKMVTSELVDFVSFTGSTETGRSVMKGASGNIKKIALELGGKSPNIIFSDAHLEKAVDHALDAIFYNQGQVCSAGSRLLIEKSIYQEFMDKLVSKTKAIKVGDGQDSKSQMGPLVSRQHMLKVLAYIQTGIDSGARLLTGGHRIMREGLENGNFVEPTIFDQVDRDMKIVKEEIFGPVLVVQTFETEGEAIRLANDTTFGLAGGVFTSDQDKGLRVCQMIKAGVMWINTYNITPIYAPWGGYKQSGIGREMGIWGYEEYTEIKQINIAKP